MANTTMTFNLASGAEAAARAYIESMKNAGESVKIFAEEIAKFNSKGEVLSRTFRGITDEGKVLETVLKQTANGFELSSGKADSLSAALKREEAATRAAAVAAKQFAAEQVAALDAKRRLNEQTGRTRDANTVGNDLIAKATDGKSLNANQLNGVEREVSRIKAMIDSGAVSLQRFKEIYASMSANPKQILPNLTKEEAQISQALRTLETGLSRTGKLAGEIGSKFYISFAGVVRLVEAQIVKRIAGAIQSSFVQSFSTAQQFSVQIAEIQTISQSAGLTTDQWADGIRRLSAEFGNNQADVAEAAYQLVSNQVAKGADAINFMSTALAFSKATVSSAADSVNLLTAAMRSFNLPISDAEKVAASFFKTIELGRVRAKDMADTFGRIGPIASEAGVSLHEVEAAITVLTTKGTKFADASTLINNVILKLLRPTDEMKKLFEEWGVTSGAAAISTFSFAGVLQKLDAEAQKGGARLGELFNQIRAVRGAVGLTGSSFAEFNSALNDVTNSTDEYRNAIKIVTESSGDILKRQLNEAKVAFEEAFGAPIIESLTRAISAIGGLGPPIRFVAGVLSDFGKVVGNVGVSLAIVFGVSSFASWAITAVNATGSVSAAFKALEAQILLATGSTKLMAAELTALQSLNIFVAGAAGGYLLGQYLFGDNAIEKAREFRKEMEKISDIRIDNVFANNSEITRQKSVYDALRETIKSTGQELQKAQSANVKSANDAKNKAIDAFRATTEATKVAGKSVLDSMNNGIKQLKEGIEKARTVIRESFNASEQLQRKLGDEIFGNRLKYASDGFMGESGFVIDEQKTALIKARLAEITNLARDKFREGTNESVDDARRLYGEAEKLTGDLFDAGEKKRRREFEDSVRRGLVAPSGMEVDSSGNLKARYDYTVSTIPLEQQLRNIANERLSAEQQLRAEKEKQIAADERAVAAEKERVRTVTQALELIAKIRVFNDKGEKVQDPVKALSEFDRQAETARTSAAQSSFAERLQLEQVLAQQRMALVQETTAFEKVAQATANMEMTGVATRNMQDRITAIEGQAAAAQQRLGVKLKEIGRATLGLSEGNYSGNAGVRTAELFKLTPEQMDQTEKMRTMLLILRSEAERAGDAFAKTGDLQTFQRYVSNLTALTEKAKEYNEFREKFDLPVTESDKAAIDKVSKAVENAVIAYGDTSSVTKNLTDMAMKVLDSDTAVKNLSLSFSEFSQATMENAAFTVQNFDQILLKVQELTAATRELRVELGATAAGGISGAGGLPWEAEGNYFGKVPSYYAGGFVPRGSDVKPAMLGLDEAVMNGNATRAWSPLLRAMNSGLKPNQMAGSNVTNVGDITVNVSGGETSQKTISEIGKGLHRGIRRGQIKL